jgi:NADH-quinone oxidoreductase subunit J
MVVLLVLMLVMLGSALAAVRMRSLVRAATALGMGSASLATMFFLLGAPYAGGFELSVGAGLISILFILTISLTESIGG